MTDKETAYYKVDANGNKQIKEDYCKAAINTWILTKTPEYKRFVCKGIQYDSEFNEVTIVLRTKVKDIKDIIPTISNKFMEMVETLKLQLDVSRVFFTYPK